MHSMTGQTHRSIGVRGSEIVAVSAEPDGLDDLAGSATVIADAGDLTLLPAFADAHEHLREASRNTLLVPVDRARSVAEFTGLIRQAAGDAPPGKWIVISMAWHESNLAENRMPTGAELDAAAPGHPVFARRGGHLAVASILALKAAGIDARSPTRLGARSTGCPAASRAGCLSAARSTKWGPLPRRPPGPSLPVRSARALPPTPLSGWEQSARQ